MYVGGVTFASVEEGICYGFVPLTDLAIIHVLVMVNIPVILSKGDITSAVLATRVNMIRALFQCPMGGVAFYKSYTALEDHPFVPERL